MKIYDAHTHIFPDKIAEKAAKSIGEFYDNATPMFSSAMAGNLLIAEKAMGASGVLVCSSATQPKQVEGINNFIASECNEVDMFIGLGSMHPDYPNIPEELKRLKSLGLLGIKLHPDFQHFYIDDEKADIMYRECEKLGLRVMFHMGDDRYDFSSPERLAKIVGKFPDLRIHAAHFGGYNAWDLAYNTLEPSENLFFDTSSSLFALGYDDVMRFFDKFGTDKYMFGSDFPMWEPKRELEKLKALKLDTKTEEKILCHNFRHFYLKDKA